MSTVTHHWMTWRHPVHAIATNLMNYPRMKMDCNLLDIEKARSHLDHKMERLAAIRAIPLFERDSKQNEDLQKLPWEVQILQKLISHLEENEKNLVHTHNTKVETEQVTNDWHP